MAERLEVEIENIESRNAGPHRAAADTWRRHVEERSGDVGALTDEVLEVSVERSVTADVLVDEHGPQWSRQRRRHAGNHASAASLATGVPVRHHGRRTGRRALVRD